MKHLVTISIVILLTVQLKAAFIYGWTNVFDTVTKPFQGKENLPALSYAGIYSNQRNGFLATAIGKEYIITANHVAPRVGDIFRANNGQVTKALEVIPLKYDNGSISDMVLVRIDNPAPYYYPLIVYKPDNGSQAISVGRSISNGNAYIENTPSFQYDILKNEWSMKNSQEIFSSGTQTRYSGLTWFRGIYTGLSGLTPNNDTSQDYFMSYTVPINDPFGGFGNASAGDSGSPTFVLQDGEWRLASIISFSPRQAIANTLGSGGPPLHTFLDDIGKFTPIPEPSFYFIPLAMLCFYFIFFRKS